MKIWMDADACPKVIKQIIFKAAERLKVEVRVVANSKIPVPDSEFIRTVTVEQGFNGADEHIVAEVRPEDLVITADIPLAARIVEKGSLALDPRGEIYDENNVGEKLATRNLMESLRSGGLVKGGPAPFAAADTNRFSAAFDRLMTRKMKPS